MEVLLLTPPHVAADCNPYSRTGAILPPLGLLYLAAYLLRERPDCSVRVIDAASHAMTDAEFRRRLGAYQPALVGMTVYTTSFSRSLNAARHIKELFPKTVLVAGGPHPTIRPHELLESPHFDMAVVGEGEEPLVQIVDRLANGDSYDGVPGLVYWKDGALVTSNAARSRLDPDKLPMPARDLVDMSMYRPAYGVFRRLPATNMITTRGCAFRCSFCSKSIFGSKVRYLSPERVMVEIHTLVRDYQIREICFNDDSFTMHRGRTEAICDLIRASGLDLTWTCNTRVNLVRPDLLARMRASGCTSVGYGIESGNEAVLATISKGISLDAARDAVRWTQDAGIEARASFILGLPGETRETINQTLAFSHALNADFVIYNVAIPIPGTGVYEDAKQRGLLLCDGTELYDTMDTHALIRLSDTAPDELLALHRSAYKAYYLRPAYVARRLRAIRSRDDLKRLAGGFLRFMGWA
ncbi:MAG: radical SAM protein [Myxococcales bacterium]